ncbi:MAG: FAD-dependent oxidoreductase [Alphaproteobacteria bacterium]
MNQSVAIIGAGVSGLTCAVLLAERGFRTAIFARETGRETTSGAAAAVWFPYHVEPAERVIPLALETYNVLVDLAGIPETGVSTIELRQFSRIGDIQVPDWAVPLGARPLSSVATSLQPVLHGARRDGYTFKSGFSLSVPLTDTTIYLDYLAGRFRRAGGEIKAHVQIEHLEDIDPKFEFVVNCSGIGARELAHDDDLEPHRGQVAIVPGIEGLSCAIVCDDAPLMYAIPRANDCVFGGTNELSENLAPDSATTSRIIAECSRVLNIDEPRVRAERVGLRPFRRTGVRLERDRLRDGRVVIHNYGHGGAGFTLSWGCAREVFDLALSIASVG